VVAGFLKVCVHLSNATFATKSIYHKRRRCWAPLMRRGLRHPHINFQSQWIITHGAVEKMHKKY
jgi:hypothetical protein